jgi:hypothetical protein
VLIAAVLDAFWDEPGIVSWFIICSLLTVGAKNCGERTSGVGEENEGEGQEKSGEKVLNLLLCHKKCGASRIKGVFGGNAFISFQFASQQFINNNWWIS